MKQTAAAVGVPLNWLRRASDDGRIPHLKVGRRRMYRLTAVRAALERLESSPAGDRPRLNLDSS